MYVYDIVVMHFELFLEVPGYTKRLLLQKFY